uniref:CYP94P5 n=1 Tax=Taxus chinensis TaxID=29808 RepID=A0A291FAV8_TAXCH|nr:CYP94P5 [Taxus chinensis]
MEMESFQIVWVFLVIMLALVCVCGRGKRCFCYSRRKKRAVHGPRSYPVVGSLFSFWKNGGRHIEWYTEMLGKSPSQTIVVERLGGVRTIVTANPANVEHILKTRFENYPKGQQFTEILQDLLGAGIFNVDGEAWKLQRKVASHEFNTRSLRSFIVRVVDEATGRLVSIMDERSGGLDLQDLLQRFAFDNICKVAFGVDAGCLDMSLPESKLAEAMDVATMLSSLRSTEPLAMVWKIKRFLNVGSERRLAEAVRIVHEFALDVIRRRRDEKAAPAPDLVSRFMAAFDDGSEEYLRDIIISFILAGRDTTSSALTWFFWLLSSHRQVEDAVYNEIMSTLAARPDADINTGFCFEELKSMNYLHAAICESMRLYPPVPFDSKHALANDVLPDGTFVAKGTRVTYHPYAMGRMKTIWGADRLEFNPGRWLDERGCFVPQSPFKYAIFQGGMRVCLGKDMAFIQMKYVAASVVARFRLRPVRSAVSPRIVHCLTSRMAGGFPVSVERRPRPQRIP